MFEPWCLYTNSILELPEDRRIAHKIHMIDFVFARVWIALRDATPTQILEEILE